MNSIDLAKHDYPSLWQLPTERNLEATPEEVQKELTQFVLGLAKQVAQVHSTSWSAKAVDDFHAAAKTLTWILMVQYPHLTTVGDFRIDQGLAMPGRGQITVPRVVLVDKPSALVEHPADKFLTLSTAVLSRAKELRPTALNSADLDLWFVCPVERNGHCTKEVWLDRTCGFLVKSSIEELCLGLAKQKEPGYTFTGETIAYKDYVPGLSVGGMLQDLFRWVGYMNHPDNLPLGTIIQMD